MTDWYVGQRIVCVAISERWPRKPVVGAVYTISEIQAADDAHSPSRCFFRLLEIEESFFSWTCRAFRPRVERESDISEFERILDRVNKREVADA